jgi:Intracellular proteinase inhibitor
MDTASQPPASVPADTCVSFTLGIDRAVYPAAADPSSPSHMSAVLTFRSRVSPPVVLEWFSYQRYDVVITDGTGAEVYRWADGRAFPMIASNQPVDGRVDWEVDVPLAGEDGTPLPPGPYVVRAYLTTRTNDAGVEDPQAFAGKYSASLGFSIGS